MSNFPPPPPGGQPPVPPQGPGQPGVPAQPGDPQQPGVPQQPQYAQPVAPDPLAEADKKRKKQLGILGGIAAVLIVAAFFGGKAIEKKNYDPGKSGYNEIYAEGAKNGHAAGKSTGIEEGTQTGKEEGTKTGKEEGIAEGTEQGKKEGQAAGEAQGQEYGASTALGGLSNWSTDTPYVVTMDQGPNSSIPYEVGSRTQMQPDTFYKICSSGSGVCTEADTGQSAGN